MPAPFSWGDFTWLNGGDRQHSALLESTYVTGLLLLDANYTASNRHPIDHTVVGSTSLARDNEFQLSFLGIGGDFHYQHARARAVLQFGTRATVVPRNDLSVLHGEQDLTTAYRYVSEANAGYHFNLLNGLNVDVGLFMSYIGLFSYYAAENWSYQPSFTSDNTPWFFNGIRMQLFPSDRLKLELWLTNGWQSYAKFNTGPGLGCQILWRPVESFQLLSNNYYGTDAQGHSDRVRLHTDNSVEYRYFSSPAAAVTRGACSMTVDVGEEIGGGVSGFHSTADAPAQFFVSAMAYHRLWLCNDHVGWTVGGGFMHNPGRYLVLSPTGEASSIPDKNGSAGSHPFTAAAGDPFFGWDLSTTVDWMPDEIVTWRLEFVYRASDQAYFAGPGGVTSPDGYQGTALPASWSPDLVRSEARIIGALLCRF